MLIQLIRNAGNMTPQQMIFSALLMFFALALSFSVHEFMHAFVANALGDDIPRLQGRLTLNPVAHLDPMGTVLIILVGFGWGKPVMYNPNRLNRFKSPRVMNIMVHLAGVTGNFVLALLSGVIATLITCLGRNVLAGSGAASIALSTIVLAFSYTQTFSLMLLAFNLLPIPPLDGFHVLEELLPYRIRSKEGYRKFEMFSPYAIWVVFILSRVTGLNILSQVISWIELPFALVINGACYLVSLPFG